MVMQADSMMGIIGGVVRMHARNAHHRVGLPGVMDVMGV